MICASYSCRILCKLCCGSFATQPFWQDVAIDFNGSFQYKKSLKYSIRQICDPYQHGFQELPRCGGATPISEVSIMARYLRFFTTVGDEQPAELEEEELHVNSEELSSATGQSPTTLTFRESLKRLYCSDRFQVIPT